MPTQSTQVPVYHPKISVLLKKNVGRDSLAGGDGLGASAPASGRFKGTDSIIDLTPFLGEAGSVNVSKGVREPAGGFNVTLADRMFMGTNSQMESLYGLIEPMDVIEIRMAHAPTHPDFVKEYQRLPQKLPIVMRGFVSSVNRTEVISPDGTPARAIQISGQDYGKLWQILQIRYFANYVMGQDLLTFLKFAQNYGVNSSTEFSPNEFMFEVTHKVLNTFIEQMRTTGLFGAGGTLDSPIEEVSVFDLTVSEGVISPFGVNSFSGGALYQMLSFFGDVGPWNELYLEDREEGVTLVYRPNPFYGAGGEEIQKQGDVFDTTGHGLTQGLGVRRIALTDEDVVSLSSGRSDSNTANYFWVNNPSYSLSDMSTLKLQAAGNRPDSYFIQDYRNCDPTLYGIRIMELQTNQGYRFDGKRGTELTAKRGTLIDWLDRRRETLIKQNRDNVVFESGRLVLKGNERVRAGMYIDISRGGMRGSYYATRVDHNFLPFRGYTTTVTYERGTGFIERAKRENGRQSPYLNELNASGVYGDR